MSAEHPVRYIVKAERNNIVVHMQEATSYDDALRLKHQFDLVPHTEAAIIVIHDPATTDLTTHAREIVESIAEQAHS